jgi:uncharacterized integral membrane protein
MGGTIQCPKAEVARGRLRRGRAGGDGVMMVGRWMVVVVVVVLLLLLLVLMMEVEQEVLLLLLQQLDARVTRWCRCRWCRCQGRRRWVVCVLLLLLLLQGQASAFLRRG